VPADITVRRADPAEADLVGELTERAYRDSGFGSGAYAEVLRDGRSRVRDGIVLVAAADGFAPMNCAIAGTVTLALPGSPLAHLCRADEAEIRMLAAQRLYERRGYLREPARDWQIRNVRLIAYRLSL
jgi:hypothetical protein